MPLALGDLGPENSLQAAPERRRDGDAFIEGLDLSLEVGGLDVPALRASRATGVPSDAAEVAKPTLGDCVVQARAALRADQRALQVVVVLPAPLPACGVRVKHVLHLVEQLTEDERLVDAFALHAPPADDADVHGIPEHPVHRALPRWIPQPIPQALLSQGIGQRVQGQRAG
ncbi:MAG TPA: hypothetical protein VF195_00255 [Actinomycetota bacterium]